MHLQFVGLQEQFTRPVFGFDVYKKRVSKKQPIAIFSVSCLNIGSHTKLRRDKER